MTQSQRARGRPRSTGSTTVANVQSLDRALDILELVSAENSLTLTQIAERLKRPPSTVYRTLNTLEQRQILEMDHISQTWHVGPATFRLGSSFLKRTGLIESSRPIMRTLMEATGETANLGIEREECVLFISQVETRETIRAFFPPGTRSPMHSSGIGKALLAQYSDGRLGRYMRRTELTRFTSQTFVEPGLLRQELAETRQQGYSFDNEERTEGMRCIAAPVMEQYGEAVAGLSVSGPTNRMTIERIPAISHEVCKAARRLSSAMGFVQADNLAQ